MSHVDLLVLSQHADGELPPSEARTVAEHVASCPACGAQLARMTRLTRAAGSANAALHGTMLDDDARPASCPSPSLLAGFGDAALPAAARTMLEQHVESCDPCLGDVLAARRLLSRLDATEALPVPAALRERVASRWLAPAAEPSALTRLVIRVGRAGAELIESHLVAPLRDLVEAATPLPAVRSGSVATEARTFTLHGPDATIVASIAGERDGVGLTLRLEGDDGEPLADQRVFLRRHGRSLYSARTGVDGVLRMPGIEHGVYEVDCPGIATAFQLDLRV
ncbi:MAG: zf-HC2 domain-containing protein [Candidatus Binatia bacterium]